MQKYRVGIEENQKKSTKDEIYNRKGSSERPSSDPGNPSEIMENDDFLTENETSPNLSPVVQGHSGDAHGPGNACYDALRPPGGLLEGSLRPRATHSAHSEDDQAEAIF